MLVHNPFLRCSIRRQQLLLFRNSGSNRPVDGTHTEPGR